MDEWPYIGVSISSVCRFLRLTIEDWLLIIRSDIETEQLKWTWGGIKLLIFPFLTSLCHQRLSLQGGIKLDGQPGLPVAFVHGVLSLIFGDFSPVATGDKGRLQGTHRSLQVICIALKICLIYSFDKYVLNANHVPTRRMAYFSEQKGKGSFCGSTVLVYKRVSSFNTVFDLFKFIPK